MLIKARIFIIPQSASVSVSSSCCKTIVTFTIIVMEIRILLFLFFLTLLITDDVNARRLGVSLRGSFSRGSFSRGSTSRGSTSRSSTSHFPSSGHISHRPPSPSRSSSGGYRAGSSPDGSSSSGHMTGSNPFGYGHTTGLNPSGQRTSSSQTSHQQNKASSTSLLNAEGGGATRPSQTSPAQSGRQPSGNTGVYPRGQTGKPDFPIENKPNFAPYNPSAPHNPYSPSAPPIDHLPKSAVVPSQNHAPTSFGQSNAPYTPSHGTASHNNPSWSNPHFNPSNPSNPPNPPSTNIGFKDHVRPTSMPFPSHPTSVPYPRPPYPTSGSNAHPPPYSPVAYPRPPPYPTSGSNSHPPPYSPVSYPRPPPYSTSGSNSHPPPYSAHPYPNQPHSTFNPSQTIGHPYSYPAHIPPPAPHTFGNLYSTHPVGGTYGSAGHAYYPQQHVLAQPAAQPYIPGQTVIMVPGQQDSGRGFGQMVKEALVFSTINAGVNRLINPPHHHYINDYNRPASSTTSETHITYNNQYFNGAPSGNTPMVPASPNVPQGNVPVTYPANYPSSVNNPAITPGASIPTIVGNNANVTYPADGSSMSTTGTNNNNMRSPPVPSSGVPAGNTVNTQGTSNQEATVYFPQYRITDNELWVLTEELFAKQEINISNYLTLQLQNKSKNVTDAAKGRLISTPQKVYDYPTIYAIRGLYDIYEHNSTVKENRTPEKRKKEDLLLNIFLSTNVMARTMQWLSERGFIDPDDFERKDILRNIWFTQFDGVTSGFERVFTSERYGTDLLGVQDWIYFDYQESKKRIDYMGYVDTLKLGDGGATLLKLNFKMDDIIRPNATIFVGTLPELEMSLYTICFYARPNNLCPVSLGGAKFNIFTHSFRYYGKDLIDLALPIF